MTPIFQIPAHRAITPAFALLIVLPAWAAFSDLSTHPLNAIGDDRETLRDLSLISSQPSHFFSEQRQAPIRSVQWFICTNYVVTFIFSLLTLIAFHQLLKKTKPSGRP
jgi:hypothetical protein